ncbi:hypothetical protein NPIL_642751 [Nephila pilipes]|uniref:Uncharacterized protein n=1 Tax=Nephila pilipes TaxID=299642 RepID=A0A8X6NXC6_NEPPI|nr:hypothetical protein NPIL_642751 [Nephila pilipes]
MFFFPPLLAMIEVKGGIRKSFSLRREQTVFQTGSRDPRQVNRRHRGLSPLPDQDVHSISGEIRFRSGILEFGKTLPRFSEEVFQAENAGNGSRVRGGRIPRECRHRWRGVAVAVRCGKPRRRNFRKERPPFGYDSHRKTISNDSSPDFRLTSFRVRFQVE